ncbi:MAG: hypothetical protein CMC52_04945 [Flavobacteriaceae bacterium]|nr:hypothetical protein [Flavobacteriaceae bacterium]
MEVLENVSIEKKANIYFDGKVSSRSITLSDGSKKTLGIMMPGEYEFGTSEKEIMEILSGEVKILLPGETKWKNINSGMSFEVPENSKFKLEVLSLMDYCCSYIK